MKRKLFSQQEMREARYNESIIFSVGKREGERVYPSHFNAGDIIFPSTRKIKEDIQLIKQEKKPTKRIKSDTNPHFRGNVTR